MKISRHDVLAVAIAALGVWVFGSAANYIVIHLWPNVLILDPDDGSNIAKQVSLFYGTRMASQLPAMYFAGLVFARSRIRRRLLAAFVTVCLLEVVLLLLRFVHQSWQVLPEPGPRIALLWEIAWVLVVPSGALCFAWVCARLVGTRNENGELAIG